MADQTDRRSEGKKSKQPRAIYSRKRRMRLKAAGLCVYCMQTAVLNRVYCHDCADTKHLPLVYESNARKILKDRGVSRDSLQTRVGQAIAIDALQDIFSRGRV